MSTSTAAGNSVTNTSCLLDPSQAKLTTISLQQCGNGIVEDGEDCDPGVGNSSPCCDSSTCKFTSGSVCDPLSSPCCTQQCAFASSSQVCRAAKSSECDIAETCTGNSSVCPADVTQPNGMSCGSDGLACASGQCTSVTRQFNPPSRLMPFLITLSEQCQIVGASMGLQQACPSQGDKSCQVNCKDPNNPGSCLTLQSQMIDGSPCGG
jgi:hypothetical protein